jgi:hypothetical protein
MNRSTVLPFAVFAATILPSVGTSQNAVESNNAEIKSVPVPMPNGLVRAEAREIQRDWAPPVVHLRGDAKVRIYTATKDPRRVMVLRADEVDINQNTGEISPRGNVKLTVEEIK